jgi:hypothetical protein
MQAESRHPARLSRRLIGARWEVRGRDQGGNHAHRDPIACSLQAASLEQGPLDRPEAPLKPKDVWAIRVRLQLQGQKGDLALFNLAIDSKLRGCDLIRLQVDDVCAGGRVRDRGTVIQKKTGRPVQFEITEQTRTSIYDWRSSGSTTRLGALAPGCRYHRDGPRRSRGAGSERCLPSGSRRCRSCRNRSSTYQF